MKKMPPATAIDFSSKPQNKKIVFDDDGEETEVQQRKTQLKDDEEHVEAADEEEDYFAKRERQLQKHKKSKDNDAGKKWYHVYPQYPSSEEVMDIKEKEQLELYNLCKSSFESELPAFTKQNPSDSRWLQTALYKGTAKDRANAGALLVTSNPLANMEALTNLIAFTKISNKSSSEVISILTDLWKEVLLPPHRKLISLQLRGADWKLVKKDTSLSKEQVRRIYAYWYFESELKDQYFEYLKNLQQGIQTGQENNKTSSIIAASHLLAYAPEKEQMLLTMLVNKLGDPLAKIASKALHHLTDVAHKHPNMCGIIVAETEKLLFRNNISDRAQHFALCFLASIAPHGKPDVCTKLVNVCFALFKVLVHKGAVNNRTMQAILRCLQKAISEAQPEEGKTEILSKDMQDTVYRLVHLADIRVSVQTLGLLLQLIGAKSEKPDRFYNALYKKMLDLEITSIGSKTSAQLLHIIHRAIHIDGNVARAQAFIKRLLQLALYMPPNNAAGCLIVIHKLLKSRKELTNVGTADNNASAKLENENSSAAIVPKVSAEDEEMARFDSDGEEKYADVIEEGDVENKQSANEEQSEQKNSLNTASSSWHHAKINNSSNSNAKVKELAASKYDPYHRVPAFAGAEFALRTELVLLQQHFHPTVQVFGDSILNNKRIDYYGDPLRDFSLPHFLERFAFKNPKKVDHDKAELPSVAHKRYVSFGSRGKSVQLLTKANCTEDEMFIFNYLEQKRQTTTLNKQKKESNEDEADDDLKPGEVDDDEFEDYLDGFFGKKANAAAAQEEMDDDEIDFLKELGGEMKVNENSKKRSKKQMELEEDNDAAENDDWNDDQDDEDVESDEGGHFSGEEFSDDEEGSISLDGEDDDEGSISLDGQSDEDEKNSEDDESDFDDNDEPKAKKSRKSSSNNIMDGKNFAKKLKQSDDMSSLFAAADDFAELLEETGKSKGHGTANAIFNADKSSDKQMKWEAKRHSNAKTFYSNKKGKFASKKFGGKKKGH